MPGYNSLLIIITYRNANVKPLYCLTRVGDAFHTSVILSKRWLILHTTTWFIQEITPPVDRAGLWFYGCGGYPKAPGDKTQRCPHRSHPTVSSSPISHPKKPGSLIHVLGACPNFLPLFGQVFAFLSSAMKGSFLRDWTDILYNNKPAMSMCSYVNCRIGFFIYQIRVITKRRQSQCNKSSFQYWRQQKGPFRN